MIGSAISSAMRKVLRAVSDLRRGTPILLQAPEGNWLIIAAELITPPSLHALAQIGIESPVLVISGQRANALKILSQKAEAIAVSQAGGITAQMVQEVANPCIGKITTPPLGCEFLPLSDQSALRAGVVLAKLARLLPAVVGVRPQAVDDVTWARNHDILRVDFAAILDFQGKSDQSLAIVSEAQVPLADSEETRIVAFRPADGGLEHLAIVIGRPDPARPLLARLHSQCYTGDLLGSLRCDCGDQLRGAIKEINQQGGGVLLYLAQEGRGIGLINKLRAYELQDRGLDTMDANLVLGFDEDERIYLPAAIMLRKLGFDKIKLMTNNPWKVAALANHGLEIIERVPHKFPSNGHNEHYLHTKATRGGHIL